MVSRIGDLANIAPPLTGGGAAATGGGDFAQFMQDAGAAAVESLQRGEEMSKKLRGCQSECSCHGQLAAVLIVWIGTSVKNVRGHSGRQFLPLRLGKELPGE